MKNTSLDRVFCKFQELTCEGFERGGTVQYLANRANMFHDSFISEFEIARTWFALAPRRISPNVRHGYSYNIKHIIENWAGRYISNGAAIAAALSLDLAIERSSCSLNCWIAVGDKRKWPVRDQVADCRQVIELR